ncbi:MAG TPA: cobalamin-independent methionine synthase II family protein [Clostridia bacterium]|nr:cobalamin-independent methionine synthase II family protein [Clostridia bacterium]
MLTATKDLMLPATVTGSWPRPRWYDGGLWGRPLDTALLDVRFREQFLDAHATVIADQERAGLDILTNGDYHLDEDFAGRSWHHYPLQRWKGLEHEELQYERSRDRLLEFAPGTLMNEIETTWRWPRVVGKVEHDPRNPLEYAKLWRIAQARAASGKPVKFGTCSSQVLSIFLDSHTSEYDLEDKKQLIWDMAGAMNTELRQLAAAGARVIQIEEPTIHFVACFYPDQTDLLDFLVDAFNHEVEGLDDAELWIHTCWGNPNMQKVYTGESYANSIEIYLERLKGDVWTIEATENDLAEIDLFKPFAGSLSKKVAVGVVNHRTLQADMPPVVAARVRRALEVIPADKLILSTDCGFGRQGFNRTVAFYKTTAIAQARNIVLRELGLEERYVPAADPSLQVDVLPDREPLTHLPSPWT